MPVLSWPPITDKLLLIVPLGNALTGPAPPKRCAAVDPLLRIKRHPAYSRPQTCHLLVSYTAALVWTEALTCVCRQDLNAATIIGSERTLDHTLFSELYWRRDPLLINLYTLPSGFLKISHLLTKELVEIIEDVHALLRISEMYCDSAPFDAVCTMQIDNQQAWIESRIQALTILENPILKCCCFTLYLCTYLSYTTVWQSALISVSHLSTLCTYSLD